MVRESVREIERRLIKYIYSMGIKWSPTLDEVEKARKESHRQEKERWMQLTSLGQGISWFARDKIGNTWLYNPGLLKPSRYLDALRLRTNTFGTRIVLRRADGHVNPLCRRCDAARETLGHILGLCIHTKPQRIRRHDEVKNFKAEKLSMKYPVFVEPTIRIGKDLKRPDLMAKDQQRLIVMDVIVRYK